MQDPQPTASGSTPGPLSQRTSLERQRDAVATVVLGDPHEDCAHAFFHCTEGELCPQRATWHAQMAEALRGSRAYPAPGMSPLVWTNIDPSIRLSLALGAPPPVSWHFPGPQRHASDALWHSCHQACVQASASFALLICKALRQYHEAMMEDLEANHTTSWPAVLRTT